MKKRDHSKTAGFTLIELLVVIAILAILVAVGIPVYTGYISRANDAAVSTELNAVLTAAEAANATNSAEIKSITVSTSGEVKVQFSENGNVSNGFYQNFADFYGVERQEGDYSIIIKSLSDLLSQSTTYQNGAKWSGTAWGAWDGTETP